MDLILFIISPKFWQRVGSPEPVIVMKSGFESSFCLSSCNIKSGDMWMFLSEFF